MGIPAEVLDDGEKEFDEVVKESDKKPDAGEKDAAKKPADKPDTDADKDGDSDKPKTYEKEYRGTQTALKQERDEKRRLAQELEGLRHQVTGLESLKNELNEHRQAKQAQAEVDEYQKDPAAYLMKNQIEQGGKVEKIAQDLRQASESQQRIQQFQQAVSAHEQAFQSEKPDYLKAVDYLKTWELKDMEAAGIPVEQRQNILRQKATAFAFDMLRRGMDPAKAAYDVAVVRGYKLEEQKKEDETVQDANKKVEQLEKGLKAAQTLTKGTKSGEESSLLKRIEEMSDPEFDDFWNKEVKTKKSH